MPYSKTVSDYSHFWIVVVMFISFIAIVWVAIGMTDVDAIHARRRKHRIDFARGCRELCVDSGAKSHSVVFSNKPPACHCSWGD